MGILRLFLALVVVIDHCRLLILRPAGFEVNDYFKLGMNAGYAVMFFYIISGFLISLVLDTKYTAGAKGTWAFYKARGIRIYSLYWPIYLFSLLMYPGIASRSLVDRITSFFLLGADWRVCFKDYPHEYFSLFPFGLNPAWSLGVEMTFYLLAPFLLRSTTALLCVFLMSVATRIPLVQEFGFLESWTYHFFPSTVFFFLIGKITYRFSKKFPDTLKNAVWFLPLAALFSIRTVGMTFDNTYLYLCVFFFALALPSLFHHTKNNRVMNFLGDLSFPVYLTQVFIISYFGPRVLSLMNQWFPGNVTMVSYGFVLLFSLLMIAVATGVFLFVERFCASLMKKTAAWMESVWFSSLTKLATKCAVPDAVVISQTII